MIGSAFGIGYLFETFPLQTNLLFCGLILGSLPTIYGKVRAQTMRLGHILAAIIFFAVVVGMAMMNGSKGSDVQLGQNAAVMLKLFLVGVLASATMVIPGVSGSMLLLVLGYYNPIIDTIKTFFLSALELDFQTLFFSMLILVPFGIGVLTGTVAIAKIIEKVFERFSDYAYWSILGLLFASPIAILMVGSTYEMTIGAVLVGGAVFLCGFGVSNKLGDK